MRIVFTNKFIFVLLSLIFWVLDVYSYNIEVNGIYYNYLSSTTVEVTNGTNDYRGDLVIPPSITINGSTYEVTTIGSNAFMYDHELTSVQLPYSIKRIKDEAFAYSDLKNIHIPYNVESIGNRAFSPNSDLIAITVDNNNTHFCSIEGVLYSKDKATLYIYPSAKEGEYSILTSCTTILEDAFCMSKISSVTIPYTVTTIYDNFSHCNRLQSIKVHSSNPKYCDIDGVLFSKDKTTLLKYPEGKGKNYLVPDCCIHIGEDAFSLNSTIESVVLPNTLRSIGWSAFSWCSKLNTISLPNSLESIDPLAFNYSGLSTIYSYITNPFPIDDVFNNSIYTDAVLFIPKGRKTVYANTAGWSKFQNIQEMTVEPEKQSLTISSYGYGSVLYDGITIRTNTQTFEVETGTNATLTLSPDNGHRIASLILDNLDVTSKISNNRYTISNIQTNTSVVATFEEIPPTYYNLTLTASGGGMITYDGVNTRNTTRTNSVIEGTNATLTFTPDNGYRLASLKVNNTNVTSSVTNNKYTISNIQRNTTVVATFEEIPPTYYNLTLTASGSGMITYNGANTRNTTRVYSVVEGTNATLTLTPDNGYRLASLKVNNTNVTSSVTNNKYTISNIQRSTTVIATFEEIPTNIYNLTLTASGGGMITYNGANTRNTSRTQSVVEGTNATLTFTPDNGYRLASVRVNNSDVTASVLNNSYTIKNIRQNTTVSAIFEQTPTTFYTLSITAAGNGSVSYGTTNVRGGAKNISVSEGTNATITFTPDNGYRLASVKVNSADVTANVSNNAYTISNIRRNTTVSATFEQIPVATFDLKITATGNGRATYDGYDIRNNTWTFSRERGTNCTITFTPDEGNRIASVTMNGSIVNTSSALTISDMNENKIVVVTFVLDEPQENTFTEGGINYSILSTALKNVAIANGNYSGTLTIPRTVTHGNTTWNVVAIADKAFYNCSSLQAIVVPSNIQSVGSDLFTGCLQLSAIQWNSSARLTEAVMGTVTNPNLLLYVSNRGLAPSTINNVVVNGTAESIRLSDAVSGNNFFCPIEFTAKEISYTHRFGMTSGRGTCQGWETLVLPFDVQEVKQGSTVLTSFVTWSGDRWARPFWLYGMTNAGFRSTGSIRANTPYIISMPNNTSYDAEWNISGDVTFSATQARVYATTQLTTAKYNGKTFTPCYTERPSGGQVYALNVNNLLGNHANGYAEGSVFVNAPARTVHPFEAYLETQTASAKTAFSIFEDMTEETPTGMLTKKAVYNLSGQLVKLANATSAEEAIDGLPAGIYIVDGKKVVRATP